MLAIQLHHQQQALGTGQLEQPATLLPVVIS
jgi:hypothetical protein